MAVITGAAIAAAGALGGAAMASRGAKDAARTQARGFDAATAEQQRQFDAMMEMTAPQRQVEGQALNQLAQLTGLRGSPGQPGPIDPTTGLPMGGQALQPGAPDYSAFYNSPDYQFALQQGEQSAMRGASAMGNLRSGNTLAALTRYGSGLASQNFGNYVSRLQGLAGMGATNGAANAMLQQGQLVGNNLIGGAGARASGVAGAANAWGSGLNQLGQLGGYAVQQWGQQQPSRPPSPQPVGIWGQQAINAGGG